MDTNWNEWEGRRTSNIQLQTLNLNLRNVDRFVSRGSGNPAALLGDGKRQEGRFYASRLRLRVRVGVGLRVGLRIRLRLRVRVGGE